MNKIMFILETGKIDKKQYDKFLKELLGRRDRNTNIMDELKKLNIEIEEYEE